MFTWRWETPSRWGNLLRWGDPPHVTSPICQLHVNGSLVVLYWTVTPCLLFCQFRLQSFTTATLENESGGYKEVFRCREVWQESMYGLFVRRDRAILFYIPIPPPASPRLVDETFSRGRLRDVLKGSILEERFFWRGVVVQNCNFLRVQIPRINFWKDKGRAISSI